VGEYVAAAAAAWFTGFFPLAEIYVAVPVALAAGLDPVSAAGWSAFGNIVPLYLIHWGYDAMRRNARLDRLLQRMSGAVERARHRIDRHGPWVVFLVTPWTGVWVIAIAAKAVGMDSRRFLAAATLSVVVYAAALVALIELGLAAL
jgi:uncharacterized membrane protein